MRRRQLVSPVAPVIRRRSRMYPAIPQSIGQSMNESIRQRISGCVAHSRLQTGAAGAGLNEPGNHHTHNCAAPACRGSYWSHLWRGPALWDVPKGQVAPPASIPPPACSMMTAAPCLASGRQPRPMNHHTSHRPPSSTRVTRRRLLTRARACQQLLKPA